MTIETQSNLLSIKQIITSTLLSGDHADKLEFLQEMQREVAFLIVAVIGNEMPDISEIIPASRQHRP